MNIVNLQGYNSAVPLLGIHTEETIIERDTNTPMFIVALFTIARTWKQPRCHRQMNGQGSVVPTQGNITQL